MVCGVEKMCISYGKSIFRLSPVEVENSHLPVELIVYVSFNEVRYSTIECVERKLCKIVRNTDRNNMEENLEKQ